MPVTDMKKRNTSGLTLPEVMAATVVLAIALLPSLWFFISGTTGIHVTRNYHTAVLFAQEAVEACRAYSFTWLDSSDLFVPGSTTELAEPFRSINQEHGVSAAIMRRSFVDVAFEEDNGDDDRFWNTKKVGIVEFTRTVEIFNVAGSEAGTVPECKIIEVTVSWIEPSIDRELSVTMTTALARTKI